MTILPLNAHMRNHIVVIRMFSLLLVCILTYATAVVCFISDPALIDSLKPSLDEVDYIFTHPLRACHTGALDEKHAIGLAERRGKWWLHDEAFHVGV